MTYITLNTTDTCSLCKLAIQHHIFDRHCSAIQRKRHLTNFFTLSLPHSTRLYHHLVYLKDLVGRIPQRCIISIQIQQ